MPEATPIRRVAMLGDHLPIAEGERTPGSPAPTCEAGAAIG